MSGLAGSVITKVKLLPSIQVFCTPLQSFMSSESCTSSIFVPADITTAMFLMAGDTGRGATNNVSAMATAATQIRWPHAVFFMVPHHLSRSFANRYLEVSAGGRNAASIVFVTCVQPCVLSAFCRVSDTSHLPSRTPALETSIGPTHRDATLAPDHRNASEEPTHEPLRRAPWRFGAAGIAGHAGLGATGAGFPSGTSRAQRGRTRVATSCGA